MQSARAVWDRSVNLLKGDMTDISFNTWIKPVEPLCIQDNTLVLLAPSQLAKTTLGGMYLPMVAAAVYRAAGNELDISFVDPDEKEKYLATTKPEDHDPDFMLNPKYTFDSFVIGGSNNFAHAAALAVADNPATAYNPLFIYGGVGLGKTHLMQAIGNRIKQRDQNAKIIYVTSETFTNEMIQSIQEDRRPHFRNRYRSADVLMVDDVQFISGKVGTQEEFFNTFNALHTSGRQIILTSDKPPMELTTLEERLRSRFEGGLIADIQPPDVETRIAILRNKAQNENKQIDDDVIYFIAEKVVSNIRQLEGALNRVIAYSSLTNRHIDIPLADSALKDIIPGYGVERKVTIQLIQEVVSDYYGIDVASMLSQRRTMETTYPRHIAMYLCKEMTDSSLKTIGKCFGGRDHTTVINACRKIDEDIKNDPQLPGTLKDIKKRIK